MRSTIVLLLIVGTVLHPASEATVTQRGLDIYWCDVEGGAATLIVTPAGESILIDSGWPGGRDSARIARMVREVAGLRQIDHAITTHWHVDHIGGLSELSALIPIRRFYDGGFPEPSQRDASWELIASYKRVAEGRRAVLRVGQQIPLKQAPGALRVTLTVVAARGVVIGEKQPSPQIRACPITPPHPAKPLDEGDDARSLAFVLTFGEWRFFDAGDLSWNVEHKLVCPNNLVGEVDVYQVTCHGAAASNHPAILASLRPRVAIMNNGARKGGQPEVVRAVKELVGNDAFFALHRNVQTGPDSNALPELTANDQEDCAGEYIALSVASDGHSYTVRVHGKKTIKTFMTRTQKRRSSR